MIHEIKFYKEPDGRWYADLPEYLEQGGTKEDCEMVGGADNWLDIIAQERNEVWLSLSTDEPLKENLILDYTDEFFPEFGAYYKVISYNGIEFNHRLWVCPVTLFVFGNYPKIIYYE